MTGSDVENIEAAALQLSFSERTRLVERLLASLDEDDEILATWVDEAERRADAFERGEIDVVDFDEAVARLKAKLSVPQK